MNDYAKLTNDEFGRYLSDIIDESPASHLLSIPGIYEILAEEFNNEILTRWESDQEV